MTNTTSMRTTSKPKCICCGSEGALLYPKLKDRLFGADGEWNIKRCPAPDCHLIWLDPSPIAEDLHLAYQNYYTHTRAEAVGRSLMSRLTLGYQAARYGYLRAQTKPWQRHLGVMLSSLRFFKEHMDYPFVYFKDSKPGRLLELGVGNGATFRKFKDWGWQVEGIDFDPQAVKTCTDSGLNVKQGDLAAQRYPDGAFDAIFSSHVLEHVPDPLALMQESARILKQNGLFVAVTPNSSSCLHGLFKSNWRGLEPPRHIHIFSVKAMRRLAERAGFSHVEVVTSNYSASGVFYSSVQLAAASKHKMLIMGLANLARLALNLYHYLFPDSGEELILIARK